jgi:tetratricopeptide (TPR) repeat protein
MLEVLANSELWQTGACFGSMFLGSVVANLTSDLSYDVGKAGLEKLIEGAELQENGLPANHDLRKASRDSLQAAMIFAVSGTAGLIGKKPPLFAALWRHWKDGTLSEQTLITVRDTDDHRWLAGLEDAAKRRFADFDDRVRFEDADAATLLLADPTAGLDKYLHKQFSAWANEQVVAGKRPAAFEEGLRDGWPVQDGQSRVTLFHAYCLFFRERLKKDTNAFRAFVGPAIAELMTKVDRLQGAAPLDADALVETLYQKTVDELDDLLHELVEFLTEEFGKVHGHLDDIHDDVKGAKAGIDEIKDELKKAVITHAAKPAIKSPVSDYEEREEMETVRAEFRTSGVLITALHGAGGIGKTELALKLAAEEKDRFPDGQIMVELLGTSPQSKSPGRAMEEVLRALLGHQVALPEDPEHLAQRYTSELAARQLLLLLDNAATPAQVAPLMPPASCGVVVTSRQMISLDGLQAVHLGKMAPESAAHLARRIAPRIGDLAEELVQECGYLAKAVRLAATAVRTSTIAPQEYLERLKENRLASLSAIAAALQTSYDLLRDDDDRTFWRRLGVFPETFDLVAAAAVAGDGVDQRDRTQETIDRLGAASMVEFDEATSRYWLHDLARDFAAQQLAGSSTEQRQAARRHAQHFVAVLAAADNLYLEGGANLLASLAAFDGERANIEAAQTWAAGAPGQDAAKLALQLPAEGAYILNLRLHPRNLIGWLESAVRAAREIGDRWREGNALGNLGIAYGAVGDARKAIEFFEQVLLIAHELGDRRAEGNTLGNLGNAYGALGNFQKAIEFYEQRLAIAREIGDRRGKSSALNNLGVAYGALGDARKAIEFYKQHVLIAREIGDRRGEGSAIGNLGLAYATLGDTRKAIEFHEQHVLIAREIGDRRGEGSGLGNLGLAYATLGDTRKAIELHEQHVQIAREIGDRRGEGSAIGNLGLAYAALGDARKAIEFHEQNLLLAREIGDRRSEGSALGNLGNAYAALGDARKAIKFYEQRLVIAREIGDRRGEGNALWNWALGLKELGDQSAARDKAVAALAMLEAIESPLAERVRSAIERWDEENSGAE